MTLKKNAIILISIMVLLFLLNCCFIDTAFWMLRLSKMFYRVFCPYLLSLITRYHNRYRVNKIKQKVSIQLLLSLGSFFEKIQNFFQNLLETQFWGFKRQGIQFWPYFYRLIAWYRNRYWWVIIFKPKYRMQS